MSLLENVHHLSFSSIALFKNAPAVWCIEKLMGIRSEVGPAAWRGTAVEAGVDLGVMRTDCEDMECLSVALQNFAMNSAGEISEAIDKERANIEPMLKLALSKMREHPMPVARQLKIDGVLDDVPIPIIGYIDYSYEDKLIDLKTTLRMPSEPKPDHIMQVALYRKKTNKTPSLLYVTPKRVEFYTPSSEALDTAMNELCVSAKALCRALDTFSTPEDMARCYAPNFDSFYWSAATKAKAMEVYNQEQG